MRIWVAMSGGVDSSLAAALLQEQGHEVSGVTLALLETAETSASIAAAAAVCDRLGIPHAVLDAVSQFEEAVIEPYLDAYADGQTPNPCIRCNTRIKFGWLLEQALAAGAERLATGHYARLETGAEGKTALLKAADPSKDQSYFLYGMDQHARAHTLFPLGGLTKAQVRERARAMTLPTAHRPESQEACFTAQTGHASYVCAHRPQAATPGDIVDTSGRVVGTHKGIARYTIGQRKGLGIGGLGSPVFVVEINAAANTVIVGSADELKAGTVTAQGRVPRSLDGATVTAAVRFRMKPEPAVIHRHEDTFRVEFESAVGGVAPGQSVVCYVHDEVVAGGEITCAS